MKKQTYRNYLAGTKSLIEQNRLEKRSYRVEVLDQQFIVRPNVFSPKYFHDTEIFAREIPIKGGEVMLEVGTGTGIISIVSSLKGIQRALAVDWNEEAVKNARENVQLHKFESRIEVRRSNIFSAIKAGEKFDLIFWNVPFGFVDEIDLTILERAVFDPGYKSIKRYCSEAKRFLTQNGRLLVGFSTTLGKFRKLKAIAGSAGYALRKLVEVESTEVYPVLFQIFEAVEK